MGSPLSSFTCLAWPLHPPHSLPLSSPNSHECLSAQLQRPFPWKASGLPQAVAHPSSRHLIRSSIRSLVYLSVSSGACLACLETGRPKLCPFAWHPRCQHRDWHPVDAQ